MTHELGPLPGRLVDAIEAYWEAAYAEGEEGRDTDTEDGAAELAWTAIHEEARAYAAAEVARAVSAEREACAQECERVAYTHAVTSLLGPEQNALKCAAAIRKRPAQAHGQTPGSADT